VVWFFSFTFATPMITLVLLYLVVGRFVCSSVKQKFLKNSLRIVWWFGILFLPLQPQRLLQFFCIWLLIDLVGSSVKQKFLKNSLCVIWWFGFLVLSLQPEVFYLFF
jgi:hypothetical protein